MCWLFGLLAFVFSVLDDYVVVIDGLEFVAGC